MKDEEENKDHSEANEPEAVYPKKRRLRFFSSFEEMNEADAKEMAALSPLQHLQNATFTIENIYSDELKLPFTNLKIHFSRKKE